jgi:hypothetical protein
VPVSRAPALGFGGGDEMKVNINITNAMKAF